MIFAELQRHLLVTLDMPIFDLSMTAITGRQPFITTIDAFGLGTRLQHLSFRASDRQ